MWDAIYVEASCEVRSVSLFSRLRAVVSGDDYLDGDYDDELDYDGGELPEPTALQAEPHFGGSAENSGYS